MITITLLAFLVVLVVSLATLTRVETQVSSNSQQLAQARQNALFALNIALGQLQKAAGPDQRVTATAEALSNPVDQTKKTDPTKYKWTGVWDSRINISGGNATISDSPVWLVSGDPANPPSNVGPILPTNPSVVELVGSHTTDIITPGNQVVVPLEDIKSDTVPGFGANTIVGRYGYWVGDEGVKARINLSDPYASQANTTLNMLNRLGTAQTNAWELFNKTTSATPQPTDLATDITSTMTDASNSLLSQQQIKFLSSVEPSAATYAGATSALDAITTTRYHDYSLWSTGVQADVRNGGLKWDLSTAFDMSDALYKTSEFSAKAANRVDPRDGSTISPIPSFTGPSAPSLVKPPAVSFVFLPQVSYSYQGVTTTSYLRGSTWDLLKSHYQIYKTQLDPAFSTPTPIMARAIYPAGNAAGNSGDEATSVGAQSNIISLYEINKAFPGGSSDPNTNTTYTYAGYTNLVARPTQTSITPYINRIFVRFGIKTVPKTVTTSAGVSADVYSVQLVMTPFVVLHNPYNIPVTFHSYSPNSASLPAGSPNIAAQIGLFHGLVNGLPLYLKVNVNGVDYMPTTSSNGSPIIDETNPSLHTRAGIFIRSLAANNYYSGKQPSFNLLIPDNITVKPGELLVLYPASNSETPFTKSPDSSFMIMGTTPNIKGGFVFSYLNGCHADVSKFIPLPNQGNNAVNPPLINISDGSNPNSGSSALTLQEFKDTLKISSVDGLGYASEIWCNSSLDPIKVIFNSDSQNGTVGYFEIKYGIESQDPFNTAMPDDATYEDTSRCSSTYQLGSYAPNYIPPGSPDNGISAYLAQYSNYGQPGVSPFKRADDYPRTTVTAGGAVNTKYLFGIDYYVKPSDCDINKASRPYITSSPLAFEQYGPVLGGQNTVSGKGTNGFPFITPDYEMDFIDMPAEAPVSFGSHMYTDSNGNAIWGPHNGSDSLPYSKLDISKSGLGVLPLINLPLRPLTSLADLQNANIAFYGYQPYFAVSNSYASPYIPANSYLNPVGYAAGTPDVFPTAPNLPYYLYDLSYLMNWSLSDKYFFSSLGQEYDTGSKTWNSTDALLLSSIQKWTNGTRTLPNSRYVPYNSTRITAANNIGANISQIQTDYRQVAASMLTLGSFNINSLSVDAWAAVLGAARSRTVPGVSGNIIPPASSTPFPRLLPSLNISTSDGSSLSQKTWQGFTMLTDAQIRQFAKNVVDEISRRQNSITYTMTGVANPITASYTGPFRSLADFINRNLANDLTTTATGASGALQAALDEHTNPLSPNYIFYKKSNYPQVADYPDTVTAQSDFRWAFNWSGNSNVSAGQGPTTSTALGFILQADVLQQIGPYLSARSDTFTIRTYGESVNPATGTAMGKAWCEAVVQRLPEYIDQTDTDLTQAKPNLTAMNVPLYDAAPPHTLSPDGTTSVDNLSALNKMFGRRFKIVSFRWLGPKDI